MISDIYIWIFHVRLPVDRELRVNSAEPFKYFPHMENISVKPVAGNDDNIQK